MYTTTTPHRMCHGVIGRSIASYKNHPLSPWECATGTGNDRTWNFVTYQFLYCQTNEKSQRICANRRKRGDEYMLGISK